MIPRLHVEAARLFQTDRKSLILNGEMSEWLKEHAWKLNPLARADPHQIPPTHFRLNDFRYIDVRRVRASHRLPHSFL
jgi:hypothetical protein